jgi:hypothetical protein
MPSCCAEAQEVCRYMYIAIPGTGTSHSMVQRLLIPRKMNDLRVAAQEESAIIVFINLH